MANWITLRQAAEKYETTVKDVLSWSELPEITFTYVNYTLLLNDDSVCDFIKLHSLPAEAGKDYGCAITFENVEIIAKLYANALEKIRLLEKQTELLNECVSKQSKLFESIEERLAAMLVSMGDTEIQDTDPINEESKFAAFMKKILLSYKKCISIFHLPPFNDYHSNNQQNDLVEDRVFSPFIFHSHLPSSTRCFMKRIQSKVLVYKGKHRIV